MEKLEESISEIEKNTLKSTKKALQSMFAICSEVPTTELERKQAEPTSESARRMLALFLAASHIREERYGDALSVAKEALETMKEKNARALDGVLAGLWSAVRISAARLGVDMISEYLVGLAESREFENTETTTVLTNAILMGLRSRRKYDEAYTFLGQVSLPESADVGQCAVFAYLAAVINLMAGEYGTAEALATQATVKSTDEDLTVECKKVLVLSLMHQGRHPNREYFQKNPGLENYQRVLLAIKSCDLQVFEQAVSEGKNQFLADGLWEPILRLECAVQKERLRKIGVVYSRISLGAVGNMLGVSEESAAFLLQRAIDEGIITGEVCLDSGIYQALDGGSEKHTAPKVQDMLALANALVMLRKHEPVKKKSLEEMKGDMAYNEYQM